jgi:hypothetical protein
MIVVLARTARRQQRHLDAIVINDRIRALAIGGADAEQIRNTVRRGDAYVRRIAGWRLK